MLCPRLIRWLQPWRANAPRRREVLCLTREQIHRMSYLEWGRADNPRVLLCVHGLTRNALDFEPLARALCGHYRVVCPDMPGRGDSDWLAHHEDYVINTYQGHILTLIARLDVAELDFVGTSMGALLGMALAALPGNPVRRLVLNDAGAQLEVAALRRIAGFVGRAPVFPDFAAVLAYQRHIGTGFGPLSDAQWAFLARNAARQAPDGWHLRYDPAIGDAMRATLGEVAVNLWHTWDAVRCPTLLLRGEHSDLTSAATAQEMARRGPQARCVEVPATGHAPMLLDDWQIGVLRDFLLEGR